MRVLINSNLNKYNEQIIVIENPIIQYNYANKELEFIAYNKKYNYNIFDEFEVSILDTSTNESYNIKFSSNIKLITKVLNKLLYKKEYQYE